MSLANPAKHSLTNRAVAAAVLTTLFVCALTALAQNKAAAGQAAQPPSSAASQAAPAVAGTAAKYAGAEECKTCHVDCSVVSSSGSSTLFNPLAPWGILRSTFERHSKCAIRYCARCFPCRELELL